MNARRPVLSEALQTALAEVGAKLRRGERIGQELDRALDLMAELSPSHIAQADRAIATAAMLYPRLAGSSPMNIFWRRPSDLEQLLRTPKLELLFIFHRDGRAREAALRRMSGGLSTAFMFAAVAFRLNDWAAPVRQAAVQCAGRCFPFTSPAVVVQAAIVLLIRQVSWRRWSDERQILDEVFGCADVTEHLAGWLISEVTGPLARILRFALRMPSMDVHLERIARDAVQPSVRAVALDALINRKAEWPVGYALQWVDKSMGLSRRVTVLGHRELEVAVSRSALLSLGIHDRSPAVRRVTLDCVIRHMLRTQEGRHCAALLAADRSPSVRARAEFILRPTWHSEPPA
jgi:hypothetical protein